MDIYTSKQPSAEQLAALIDSSKPVEFWTDWLPLADSDPDVHGVVLTKNHSEYPVGLAFQVPIDEPEMWLLNLAREMSTSLGCRTLYTGCPLPEARPHHSVVFDHGLAFLASDLGTTIAGDGNAPVSLYRRLPDWDAEL